MADPSAEWNELDAEDFARGELPPLALFPVLVAYVPRGATEPAESYFALAGQVPEAGQEFVTKSGSARSVDVVGQVVVRSPRLAGGHPVLVPMIRLTDPPAGRRR